jgi:hypothetical protein
VREKLANAVINRVTSKAALEAKRKAANLGSTGMPDKLADCRRHGPTPSSSSSRATPPPVPAKQGRDAETMAVLPLRGKVVNAGKATLKQVLDNTEAQALFTAIGAGSGKEFDLDDARYGRIVILCDADVDGSHIRCLLLTLIYHYMRPMLDAGRVFAAQPPLYTTKVGDETYRAFSDAERDASPPSSPRATARPRTSSGALQGPRRDERRRARRAPAPSTPPPASCAASPWPTPPRPPTPACSTCSWATTWPVRRDYLLATRRSSTGRATPSTSERTDGSRCRATWSNEVQDTIKVRPGDLVAVDDLVVVWRWWGGTIVHCDGNRAVVKRNVTQRNAGDPRTTTIEVEVPDDLDVDEGEHVWFGTTDDRQVVVAAGAPEAVIARLAPRLPRIGEILGI